MVLPVVGEALVEVGVVLFGNVFGLSHPDWLGLVEFFKFSGDFFYLLFLLVLLFVFFDLNVVLLLFFFLIIGNLLLSGLLNLEINWESNEFRVFLDQIFQFSFFEEFNVVRFDVKDDFRSSSNRWSIIFTNGECSTCSGFPSVLLFLFGGFGNDGNFISNEES